MKKPYQPSEIEPKWQARWEADGLYRSVIDHNRPKHYALTMLPYPSGNLHIGHWYAMTPSDARARYKRMKGFNVLFPMGFDAFGLPAENAAIERNIHPKEWTYANIENMRKQLRSMGAMFDWEREAVSADLEYYVWTEWFFLQLHKYGLAYRKMAPVDWCPHCNTTLAREQVIGEERRCERCKTPVIRKDLEQWFFRITNYAEELLNFAQIDWPENIELMQTNWIGRSEGASVVFHTEQGDPIEVFTTRPDTLWGATFMVLAPEHPLVEKVTSHAQKRNVQEYVQAALRMTDIQRESLDKDKTGVFTGGYAINPVNHERIPIWIADYVMMTYGTGAIMAVPAHDQRDFEFAQKFGLEIRIVIQPESIEPLEEPAMTEAVPAYGTMINSGPLSGTPGDQAFERTLAYLGEKNIGERAINYRLRDWLISRQRYWGAPIPMVYCENCGWQPVPEDQLPVVLPEDVEWLPTGESPLKLHPTWKNTICPECGGKAVRETDTMDTFMCSSWYHLRYLSPHYDKYPFDKKEYDYWMPVDTYTGGAEHATMHLMYTRFFHKAARDMGITKGPEPMLQLRNQGQILGPDGQRMSKSRGNVVDPDEQIGNYGADVVRCYLMFGYRWSEGGPWNADNIQGVVRWINRVWAFFTDSIEPSQQPDQADERALRRKLHQTLAQIEKDFESFEFNTIISSLMELLNDMYRMRELGTVPEDIWSEAQEIYLLMLAPVAPHLAEELWSEEMDKPYSIHTKPWPNVDEEAIKEEAITLVVQVNGKVRDRITVPANISDGDAQSAALASEIVQKYLEGKSPRKIIVVQNKLVNIVI